MKGIDFTYAYSLAYIIPIYGLIILIEAYFSRDKIDDVWFYIEESCSSIISKMMSLVVTVVGINLTLLAFPDFFQSSGFLKTESLAWWHYVLIFIIIDFCGYWGHRLAHSSNIFWNDHRIHHSGEIFNYATGIRSDFISVTSIRALFLIPIYFLGFSLTDYYIILIVHTTVQFWTHTEVIGRLGFLEKILVTPTSHKIHHAMNTEYIDKNFGTLLIIWDRMFGTYQASIKGVDPVVGDTRPSRSYNPLILNLHHFYRLILDAFRTNNYLDKLRIWFMPTGWRPNDVIEKYPILAIKNPKLYKEEFFYKPNNSNELRYWNFLMFSVLVGLNYFFFVYIKEIIALKPIVEFVSNPVLISIFILLCFNSLTLFMDRNKWSWAFELPQFILGMFMIYKINLLGMITTDYFLYFLILLFIYLIISFSVTIYFSIIFFGEKKEDLFYTQNSQVAYKV